MAAAKLLAEVPQIVVRAAGGAGVDRKSTTSHARCTRLFCPARLLHHRQTPRRVAASKRHMRLGRPEYRGLSVPQHARLCLCGPRRRCGGPAVRAFAALPVRAT
jgi:hypothetical protein